MERKFRCLPTPSDGEGVEVQERPPEPVGKYLCPCCGYRTLPVPPEEAVAYICPVCYWENDVFLQSDREPSDENHGLTLEEGRANYSRLGACQERLLPHVRPPRLEEQT